MESEFAPNLLADFSASLRDVNLLIATVTCVTAMYVFVVMLYWWRHLRSAHTNLRPLILGVALAKGSLCFWAATGVFQILVLDISPPLISLPARILFMVAALIQAHLTLNYYYREDLDRLPGPFENTET